MTNAAFHRNLCAALVVALLVAIAVGVSAHVLSLRTLTFGPCGT